MATSLKLKAPSLESFEETYKTAYSHGLETIYALETVDLKTVKKLVPTGSDKKKNPLEPIFEAPASSEQLSQLEIDFGERFGEWVEPFFLDEPLSVLCLSLQAHATLQSAGIVRLKDLAALDLNNAVFHKGLGQGHLEEIRNKLDEYRAGRSLKQTDRIDWRSLILSVTAGIPQKKLAGLLKEFDLSDLLPIQKDFLRQENIFLQESIEFPNESQKRLCCAKLEKITHAFLLSWIESKGGISSREEILERLENLSTQPTLLGPCLKFLTKYFTNGQFLFQQFLYPAEEELYFHAKSAIADYNEIISCAISYFPSKKECYTLVSLTHFIEKEFAKRWGSYSPVFLSEILHRSSLFSIFRDPKGILQVCLA